jgi:hypothetical protein
MLILALPLTYHQAINTQINAFRFIEPEVTGDLRNFMGIEQNLLRVEIIAYTVLAEERSAKNNAFF